MENVVKTGETVTAGTYYCTNCGQKMEMEDGQTMPPCPRCSNNGFTKNQPKNN